MLHHETWKIPKGRSDKSFFSTGDLIDSHLPSRVRKFVASPRQLRHEFRWAFGRNFCDGARRTSCHQNKHRSGNREQFQHVHLWKMQLKWLETGHFHKYFAVIFVAPHLHESSFLALPRHHERNGLVPNPRYETHPLFDTLSIYNLLQWTSSSLEKNWAELTGDPRTKAERGCIGLMASQLHRWETAGWIVSKNSAAVQREDASLGLQR